MQRVDELKIVSRIEELATAASLYRDWRVPFKFIYRFNRKENSSEYAMWRNDAPMFFGRWKPAEVSDVDIVEQSCYYQEIAHLYLTIVDASADILATIPITPGVSFDTHTVELTVTFHAGLVKIRLQLNSDVILHESYHFGNAYTTSQYCPTVITPEDPNTLLYCVRDLYHVHKWKITDISNTLNITVQYVENIVASNALASYIVDVGNGAITPTTIRPPRPTIHTLSDALDRIEVEVKALTHMFASHCTEPSVCLYLYPCPFCSDRIEIDTNLTGTNAYGDITSYPERIVVLNEKDSKIVRELMTYVAMGRDVSRYDPIIVNLDGVTTTSCRIYAGYQALELGKVSIAVSNGTFAFTEV